MPSKIRDIADILGVTETANPTNAVLTSVADGSSVSVYDSAAALPLSGLTSGDQAYVESTNRFYMSNGSGWYNIALVNTNPSISVSGSSPIALDRTGASSTTITVTSSDPEEIPVALTAVTNAAFDNFATVTNVDNVFTITPKPEAILAETNATGTITFRSSDGINIAAVNRTVNLLFQSIDSLTRSVSPVNEGSTVTFSLNVTGYDNGTTFPYTITGVSSEDTTTPLTGNITVSNGSAALTVDLVADYFTEGTETITFSAGGLSTTATVYDTSLDTYQTTLTTNAFLYSIGYGASYNISAGGSMQHTTPTSWFNQANLIDGTADMTSVSNWYRVQFTASSTSFGEKRVYFRLKLPATAKDTVDARKDFFNADLQVLGMVHTKSSQEYDHYLFTENNTRGFETSARTQTTTQPTSWQPLNTTGNPTGGFFGLKENGGVTGSTLTGRLAFPHSLLNGPTSVTNPTIESYVYAETSSPVAFGDYLWLRSPQINMSNGDELRVVFGLDAVAAESLTIYLA